MDTNCFKLIKAARNEDNLSSIVPTFFIGPKKASQIASITTQSNCSQRIHIICTLQQQCLSDIFRMQPAALSP